MPVDADDSGVAVGSFDGADSALGFASAGRDGGGPSAVGVAAVSVVAEAADVPPRLLT